MMELEQEQWKRVETNDILEIWLLTKTNFANTGELTEGETKRLHKFMLNNPLTVATWLQKYEDKLKATLKNRNAGALEQIQAKRMLEEIESRGVWQFLERNAERWASAKANPRKWYPAQTVKCKEEKFVENAFSEIEYDGIRKIVPVVRYAITYPNGEERIITADCFSCTCDKKGRDICHHIRSARQLVKLDAKSRYRKSERFLSANEMDVLNAMLDIAFDRKTTEVSEEE